MKHRRYPNHKIVLRELTPRVSRPVHFEPAPTFCKTKIIKIEKRNKTKKIEKFWKNFQMKLLIN